MTAAIAAVAALAAGLVGWFFWERRRAVEEAARPTTQHRDRYQQAEDDVAKGDAQQASIHGADDLDALDRLRLQNARKGDQR